MKYAATLLIIFSLALSGGCTSTVELIPIYRNPITLFSGETIEGSEYGLCKAAWEPENYGKIVWGRPNDRSGGSAWGQGTLIDLRHPPLLETETERYQLVTAEIAFGRLPNGSMWDMSFVVIVKCD